MKGKIRSITAKTYKDRQFFEVVMEIGDDKTRKYSCWQNHGKDLKEGQEVEYTEESKEYTDDEGNTHTNWKMILPGGAEKKPWGGKSPEELQIMKDKEDKISKLALYNTAVKVVGDTFTPEKVDQVITIAHYLYKDLNSDWSK